MSHTYDWNLVNTEFYQLPSDPAEIHPKTKEAAPTGLQEALNEFVNRPEIHDPLQEWHSHLGTLVTPTVETRLEDLGYL